MLSGNPETTAHLGMRSVKRRSITIGGIKTKWMKYEVRQHQPSAEAMAMQEGPQEGRHGQGDLMPPPCEAGAEALRGRLKQRQQRQASQGPQDDVPEPEPRADARGPSHAQQRRSARLEAAVRSEAPAEGVPVAAEETVPEAPALSWLSDAAVQRMMDALEGQTQEVDAPAATVVRPSASRGKH